MPIVTIDNLGAAGIITDLPPHELPLNAFSLGNNVRLQNDGVVRTLGYKSVFTDPTVGPYYIMPWQTESSYYWLYANATDIYRATATASTEVTRVSADYTAGTHPRWNGGLLGGVPIMNHSHLQAGDYPQSWSAATTKFINMTNWPMNATPSSGSPDWLCKVIRPFKNFLVALYMEEDIGSGNVVYPTRLRWSHPADPGTVPTAWLPAATNLAGTKTFSDSTAPLIDCLPMRDINVVYKEDSVHLMQHVGGTYVFNFRRAFSEFGLLAQRCVKPFFGKHFVLSLGDVVVHNGQEASSVIDKKMRTSLFSAISEDNYVNSFVVAYPQRTEMWVCIPVNGSGVTSPTVAYIWNWTENSWTIRDLPVTPHIALGVVDEQSLSTTFEGLLSGTGTGTFDEREGTFDARTYNPTLLNLLGVDPVNVDFVKFDSGNLAYTSDFSSYVQRTGLAINGLNGKEITVDPHTIKLVRRLYPKLVGEPGCVVDIKVGSQQFPNGPITWYSYTFNPNTQTYISCACQGKLIGYYLGSSTPHKWRFYGMGFDLDVIGTQ